MLADGGLQTAAIDVEDLNEAQWNDIPATDQVVSVDPISQPATESQGGGEEVKIPLRMVAFAMWKATRTSEVQCEAPTSAGTCVMGMMG